MEKDYQKRKLGLYTALQVVGVLTLTIIGGCWDWMNFRFDFTQLTTTQYWTGVFQQALMYSITLALGLLTTMEKLELTDIEYLGRLETYRELLKMKKQSFTLYIDETLNPYIKREAMRERAVKRLYRLDKWSKDEYKLAWKECKNMTEEEFRAFKPTMPMKFLNTLGRIFRGLEYQDKFRYSWRCKFYCYRRRKLERLASEEYINDNWQYTSVKYERVNPNAFTWSVRLGDSKLSQYQVENKSARSVALAMTRKILTVVLTSLVIGSIIYDASMSELLEQANGWLAIMIKYIIRVIMIIVNYIFGVFAGKRVFYNNFTWILINRIRILKDYINWRKSNNDVDSYADKLLETYEKTKQAQSLLDETIKKAEETAGVH